MRIRLFVFYDSVPRIRKDPRACLVSQVPAGLSVAGPAKRLGFAGLRVFTRVLEAQAEAGQAAVDLAVLGGVHHQRLVAQVLDGLEHGGIALGHDDGAIDPDAVRAVGLVLGHDHLVVLGEVGLVDELGNYYDALEAAGKAIGVDGIPEIKENKRQKPWEVFFSAQLSKMMLGQLEMLLQKDAAGMSSPQAAR